MEYRVSNIQWDDDNENVNLPKSIVLEIPNYMTDSYDIEEFLSDKITDLTGFCHKGFKAKIINS